MAIAFDNAVSAASESSGINTLESAAATFAASGAAIGFMASGAGTPSDPTSLRWGGAAGDLLTQEGATVLHASNVKLSRFSLVPPAAANRTGYGTWPSPDDEKTLAILNYTGVDQATPLRTSPTPTTGNGGTPSITATTVAGDMVVACLWTLDTGGSSGTVTSTAGQTNRVVYEGGAPYAYEQFSADDKVAVGTSTTLSWSMSATTASWIVMAYVLRPDAGGSGGTVTSKVMTSNIALTDGPLEKVRAIMMNSLTSLVDDIVRRLWRMRAQTSNAVVTDSTVRVRRSTRVPSSNVVVTDQRVSGKLTPRLNTDNVVLTDAALRAKLAVRQQTSNTVISDELLRRVLRTRLQSDSFILTDELLKQLTGSGNVATRLLTSALLLSDSLLPVNFRTRLQQDALSVTDEAALYMIRRRLADSGILLTDSILTQVVGGTAVIRVLTDTVVTTDQLLRALALVRSLTDGLDINDDVLRVRRFVKSLDDQVTVSDSLSTSSTVDVVPAAGFTVGFDKAEALALGVDRSTGFTIGGYSP